jgi:polygalacturonase
MRKLPSLVIGVVLAGACLAVGRGTAWAAEAARFDISQHGAKGDGTTLNTKAIQATIDECAKAGGGTLVIPKGEFLSGALFLKPGVNVELLEGAVLRGSKDISDFPVGPSRFEGHFQPRVAALLNAEKTDHLRITGPGTLDGQGAAYWNLKSDDGRPRLVFVRDSKDVTVTNMHFWNSATWNLHFYNCQDVTVENTRFEIDKAGKGPSTDGTDIDSCQNVTIRGCFFSVNDDCVCLKGNRYDGLDQKPESLPVANIHVTDCTFERGMGALTLGTEATYIHDVEFDHSTVKSNIPMLRLKMRPDTPGQRFENVNVHDIKLDGTGKILSWELTHGTKVPPKPPNSIIRKITVSNITGTFGSLGNIAGNDTTDVSDIVLKDINVKVRTAQLDAAKATAVTLDNVLVNDKPWTPKAANGAPGTAPATAPATAGAR